MRRKGVRNQVRAFRKTFGEMTQAKLAEQVDVTRQTIVGIEKGENTSVEVALRLAKALDANVEDLFILESRPLSRERRKEFLALVKEFRARKRTPRDREVLLKLMEESLPLNLPVPPELATEFWSILFRYKKGGKFLGLLFETLKSDAFILFLSRCNGMSISVPPRSYWEDRFRDVHIYMTLRTISKVNDPAKWRREMSRLASRYDMTTGRILRTFEKVKEVAQKEGT